MRKLLPDRELGHDVAVAAAAVSPDLGLKNSETGRRDIRGFGGPKLRLFPKQLTSEDFHQNSPPQVFD